MSPIEANVRKQNLDHDLQVISQPCWISRMPHPPLFQPPHPAGQLGSVGPPTQRIHAIKPARGDEVMAGQQPYNQIVLSRGHVIKDNHGSHTFTFP